MRLPTRRWTVPNAAHSSSVGSTISLINKALSTALRSFSEVSRKEEGRDQYRSKALSHMAVLLLRLSSLAGGYPQVHLQKWLMGNLGLLHISDSRVLVG